MTRTSDAAEVAPSAQARGHRSPTSPGSRRVSDQAHASRRRGSGTNSRARFTSVDPRTVKLKALFRKYDKDGNGTLDKSELEAIMSMLGVFEDNEMATMMAAVDKNRDGEIQYDEFVDWLAGAGSGLITEDDVPIEFEGIVRPLFNIYDRDRSGQISRQEFQEVHAILQGALQRLQYVNGADDMSRMVMGRGGVVWRLMDEDRDDSITFKEFAEWVRSAIECAGVPRRTLMELVQKLATLLDDVFTLSRERSAQSSSPRKDPVMQYVLGQISDVGHELFNTQKREKPPTGPLAASDEEMAAWTDLPEGISTDGLVHAHVSEVGVATAEVVHIGIRVQVCLPERPLSSETSKPADHSTSTMQERPELGKSQHRWLAKVIRSTAYKTWRGAAPPGTPTEEQYFYAYENKKWVPLTDGSDFYDAMKPLPPELKVYALLQTSADFGGCLSWDRLQAVLEEAVGLGFLKHEDHVGYNIDIEKCMLLNATAEEVDGQPLDREARLETVAKLLPKASFSPETVMAALTKLCAAAPHPLWIATPVGRREEDKNTAC